MEISKRLGQMEGLELEARVAAPPNVRPGLGTRHLCGHSQVSPGAQRLPRRQRVTKAGGAGKASREGTQPECRAAASRAAGPQAAAPRP